MKSLLLALQFLTIVPVKIKEIGAEKISKSMVYFPFIGLLLGLALAVINTLFLNMNFPEFSINIILVVSLAALTGGIHLDGLSDTADAIFSGKNREEMLTIMRDSHIGVMGVLALISTLLLKIAFLYPIGISSKINALLLMCVLSRWSMVFTMFLFPYARKEGKAKAFINGINLEIFVLATIVTSACAFAIWKIKGVLVLIIIAFASYIAGKFINKKIGGVTGDTLGAFCELNEIITLSSMLILTKSFL